MRAPQPVRPGRLVGIDVARCLALLGMIATHVLDPRTPAGEPSLAHTLASGRASALFAVLAGVSLALMTGGPRPPAKGHRLRSAAGIAVRAVLIALLGLALGDLDSGLAIILAYYGVLFLLGLPFLALRARPLAVLAAGWVVAGPVVSHLVRPELPPRGFASPDLAQLAEPGRLASELLFTGYYPAVPWLAYLLAGMALGRTDLRGRLVPALVAAGGAALAVAAYAGSRALTATERVRTALFPDAPEVRHADLLDAISGSQHGTTPTGGPWEWLVVVSPHSGTPFDLAQTIGSALLVIGACLLVVDLLPPTGRVAVAVLFGAGTMTLTLYSLHVVMRTDAVWPPEEPDSYVWHVLVVLAIGAVFVALGRRGPLEELVGGPARALRRPDRPL
ncbi:heparan-alpha-glucosaminide N-acetyltransferase domain-containing protein [Nocardioides sp. TF02-7]|uniref:heparan-alpha-glucosaminide N-acetyltransferase domain-containing protein n=1 Tax=Nocardioides sp. TF02-7 TaxID=2917724 RepID=UPI001F0555AC|nr:heparan-alpha-glucosaminide N-acetyltransferase domain-containing protein [Nocardioides sp. TF02-7]UMG93231.1 DUF1624 domain-containing protein [Nocardioides sp. TF02-7]